MRRISVRDSPSNAGDARGAATEPFDLAVPDAATLRDLIRFRVREEVARYNASCGATAIGLVGSQTSDERSGHGGGTAPQAEWRRIDWERQADIAIDEFNRNGFFVFLHDPRHGERQLEDLDDVVDLPTDAELRFIRLVRLVGG